jgi:hypothetical protein
VPGDSSWAGTWRICPCSDSTTGGETALLAERRLQATGGERRGRDPHNVGYARPNEDECGSDMRRELASLGVRIHTGSILTRGIEAGPMNKHQCVHPAYVVAQSLNVLCQGIKAAAEIVAEASEGGLLPEGADVVAMAGTGRGADTVAIVEATPQTGSSTSGLSKTWYAVCIKEADLEDMVTQLARAFRQFAFHYELVGSISYYPAIPFQMFEK